MKKRLLTILLALALAVSIIPTCFAYYTASDTRPTPSQPWYGIVKEEKGCNIRQSNAEDSTYLGSLAQGTYVHIVGVNWDWYEVQYTNNGKTGYIRSDLLSVMGSPHYYVVANANVQFRSTPSTSGSVYATIFDGESFPRRFNSGNWVCGVYATNTGYSHGDYVDGELRAD